MCFVDRAFHFKLPERNKLETDVFRGMSTQRALDPRDQKTEGGGGSSVFTTPPIVDALEAERQVESLKKFNIEEVGSSEWMRQHEMLEKLNLQAHQSAMTQSDEYILEAVLTYDKLETLLHDLLIIEAWKEFIYPLLSNQLANRNSMRCYFILYHEATVVNLLECFLYHKHVVEAGGEKILELVDYVARKLSRLNGGYDFRNVDAVASNFASVTPESVKDIASSMESRTPLEELSQHFTEIEFRVCISATSIGRFLCEHADAVPLSVLSRITDTHDLLMLFIPLIENPPWTRRLDNGKWQKLVDFKWQDTEPIDLLKVSKLEGQPWIGLYFAMAKEVFRERYHINSFRKGQILRVRKYLSEVLLDQLPFLVDIQRYMDELAITEVAEPHLLKDGAFLFQQVSLLRESILKNRDWEKIAEQQMVDVFTMTDKTDSDLKRMAELYADDDVGNILDPLVGDGGDDDLEDINHQLRSS